jgi:hypothetical protein
VRLRHHPPPRFRPTRAPPQAPPRALGRTLGSPACCCKPLLLPIGDPASSSTTSPSSSSPSRWYLVVWCVVHGDVLCCCDYFILDAGWTVPRTQPRLDGAADTTPASPTSPLPLRHCELNLSHLCSGFYCLGCTITTAPYLCYWWYVCVYSGAK